MKKYIFILMVLIVSIKTSIAQSTSGSNTYPGTGNYYLGWDNGSYYPLNIQTQARGTNAQRINFFTDSLFRITVDTTGFMGIGGYFNSTAPSYLLDVDSGDINIGAAITKYGYRIGHNYVLYNKADTSSIYVGVGAGFKAKSTYLGNTFAGHIAGFNDSTGSQNTFIGDSDHTT